MLINAISLAIALTTAPTGPDFAPTDVEVTQDAAGLELVAHDAAGETVAVYTTWQEGTTQWFTMDFDDGWAEWRVIAEQVQSFETSLPTAVIEERAQVIEDLTAAGFGHSSDEDDGSLMVCAMHIAASGAMCAAGLFIPCGFEMGQAWCECADVEEVKVPEWLECP